MCPWPSRHSSQALSKCMRPGCSLQRTADPTAQGAEAKLLPGPQAQCALALPAPWLPPPFRPPCCHLWAMSCTMYRTRDTGNHTGNHNTRARATDPRPRALALARWGTRSPFEQESLCWRVVPQVLGQPPPPCAVLLFGLRGTEHTGLLSASCIQHVVRPALTFAARKTHHTAGTDGQTRLLAVQPASASTGVNCWVMGPYNCDLTRSHPPHFSEVD